MKTNISYSLDSKPAVQLVAALFESSGIVRPYQDKDRIRVMIDKANLIVTAWDKENLVGIARCLTDSVYCCYLSDLAVSKTYQNNGIGRNLIQHVRNAITPQCMLLLLSAPGVGQYYEHLGFKKAENCWQIPRE